MQRRVGLSPQRAQSDQSPPSPPSPPPPPPHLPLVGVGESCALQRSHPRTCLGVQGLGDLSVGRQVGFPFLRGAWRRTDRLRLAKLLPFSLGTRDKSFGGARSACCDSVPGRGRAKLLTFPRALLEAGRRERVPHLSVPRFPSGEMGRLFSGARSASGFFTISGSPWPMRPQLWAPASGCPARFLLEPTGPRQQEHHLVSKRLGPGPGPDRGASGGLPDALSGEGRTGEGGVPPKTVSRKFNF